MAKKQKMEKERKQLMEQIFTEGMEGNLPYSLEELTFYDDVLYDEG